MDAVTIKMYNVNLKKIYYYLWLIDDIILNYMYSTLIVIKLEFYIFKFIGGDANKLKLIFI